MKNKINLDTGCVHGNVFTSVALDSWKPYFKQQKARKGALVLEELPVLFKRVDSSVSIADLEESDKKRLNYVLKNKINFISGTMAPADKDVESHELESLKQGLLYYKNHGVKEVVLQPKYMGSRCNLYLDREIENCYAVSRNGYKIKQLDLTEIYEQEWQKHKEYMEAEGIKTLVLDGELLPWRALGEGLIDRQFGIIDQALERELAFLQQHKFDEHLARMQQTYKESGFEQDQSKISKKELSKQYGDATYQSYKALSTIKNRLVPLEKHLQAYQSYKEQIELYGAEDSLQFKPFSILKIIKIDGSEEIPNQPTSEIFQMISDDEYRKINLYAEEDLEQAYEFFHTLTTLKKMEGVVIKPEIITEDVAPYLKVRNPEYLTIVYGYDYRFPHKYAKLVKQKNTKQKLRTSIKEYQLGKSMLSHKLEEISPENRAYKQVVANMLFEVGKEKGIDPRL
ncbi:hypothetical protein [Caldalkalibacillus mannanilyticus]|uniref:hypothetical protein n=1 Tax=Caldalkalibacillus mannanilyticus TaxID=1418 RepID=UPI0034E21B86